jgi:hypothetical protein
VTEPRKTHLRIDFMVQEVADDETVSPDDLRHCRFGDDVALSDVRDFFDRCGHAMGLMFRALGPSTIVLTSPGPNKINAIKALRALGNYGLKEAKDFIESAPGTPILVVPHPDDINEAVKQLSMAGCSVQVRTMSPRDSRQSGVSLPPPNSYERPR